MTVEKRKNLPYLCKPPDFHRKIAPDPDTRQTLHHLSTFSFQPSAFPLSN